MAEQTTLLAEISGNMPAANLRVLELHDLPKNLPGPPPTAAMIRNVKAVGVLQPITVELVDADKATYRVVDGRRRVMAAREAGLSRIHALVRQVTPVQRAAATIALNELRSENPLGELEAIRELHKKGYDEQQITEATGMRASRIRLRLALIERLNPEILKAAKAGKVGLRVAAAIAKLAPGTQAILANVLESEGKLTGDDVHQAKTAGREKALAELDLGVLMPKPTAGDAKARLGATLEAWPKMLEELDAPPSVRKAVEKALAAVQSWKA
jgi:ParB/RepB/Spo0J family partition protein